MDDNDLIIAEILKSFNQDNIVLFAGSNAIKNGELTKQLCSMPWSCVVTSSKADGFAKKFMDGRRTLHKYVSFSELPINLFSRENLSVIHLFGTETDKPQELEDLEEFLWPTFMKSHAAKILNRVMCRLDVRSRMVVIGYNPDSEDDIPVETFILACNEMQGGVISFFDSNDIKNQALMSFAKKNNYIWFDGKLSDMLDDAANVYSDEEIDTAGNSQLFYKEKMPAFIKTSVLSRSRNFVQLLTEERIKEIRPLGRIQQSRWYYNFLNNSSEAPQWYGFLPQSEYYLKRNYEDELLALVRRLLSGQKIKKVDRNTPIVLEGDPGSSKSVELAAVAYKIFEEKVNPVIYINRDSLFFAGKDNEIEVLDELMQEVEQIGEEDPRFLLVWDSSCYKNIPVDAKQLAHELENRGRRFVLLCSAYTNQAIENERGSREYYSYDNGSPFEKSKDKTSLYYDNGCYFISATRILEKYEISILKQKATLYNVADKSDINRLWDALEADGNNDLFDYFYRLMILIRPKLESGLSREQQFVNRYVMEQISLLDDNFEIQTNIARDIVSEALERAGISLDNESQKLLESEESNEIEQYDLNRFNICIAMFGRFKLDTPYSLALKMLCKDDDRIYGSASNSYKLFQLLTSQINYIHFCERGDGKFVFRFRSTLEAEIFLRNNQIDEERQLQIIEKMIDCYIENYRLYNEVDVELKEAIQSMLKMYGPNTEYQEFWPHHVRYNEHQKILSLLYPLTEKINSLRTTYHIPDADCGMALIEISFCRELFGNLWDKLKCDNTSESYEERLKKLTEVSDLSIECLQRLENARMDAHDNQTRRSIQTAINSLTVELSVANTEIERIRDEYVNIAGEKQYNPSSTYKSLGYANLYPILYKAILSSPLDGYLYNALFKLFEKEYQKADDEHKLYLLSEVGMIADDANTLEIENRGANNKDELSMHLYNIAKYSNGIDVKIDNIMQKNASEEFMNLFKNTLDRNNASGICFVCQQELNDADLSGEAISKFERETGKEFILSAEQIAVCQKIAEFIKRPEFSNCVDKSSQALYLLLRVEWMQYNGRPLSIGREWQRTYLNADEWAEIYAICEKYEIVADMSARPVVALIHALAKIQIENDYFGAMKVMHKITDMPNQRMRVPYLICLENGEPQKYNGTVIFKLNHTGFLKVDGLPRFYENNKGVYFYMRNIGLRSMPDKNTVLTDFCLGLSLSSQFSAYKLSEEDEE